MTALCTHHITPISNFSRNILKSQEIKNIEEKDKDNTDEYDKRIWKISKAILERNKRNIREVRDNNDRRTGKLQIAWIPAHNGIEGNERADVNAKELTEGEQDKDIKIPWKDIKVDLEKELWKKSREDMERIGEMEGVKYFTRRENNIGRRKPWFINMTGMKRKEISVMNRVRANHYNLAESLHRKGMVERPDCECGRGIEDINHVFWDCNKYIGERERLLMELGRQGIQEGDDIADAVRGDRRATAKKITEYLSRIKRDI